VKQRKCSIAYNSIESLGHIIGENFLMSHPEKVRVIKEATRTDTKRQLRSFLGLLLFYIKFVPNFSSLALPLTGLTKKGAPNKLVWKAAQEKAFRNLKHILTCFPILKLPDISCPFILQIDASDTGVGAVLLQMDDEIGRKLPVDYASRKLKDSKRKYATIEKECLAIVWVIKKVSTMIVWERIYHRD
jgi:hypothetical protein